MKQKHFMDIERFKEKFEEGFRVGDHIVIQEKIDGANFSIRYDEETDSVAAFSRKNLLNFKNNLRGAYEWSQKLNKDLVKEVLGNNKVLFGEWLVPHTIVYPKERYHNAYFYDVYDLEKEGYLPQNEVKDIAYGLCVRNDSSFSFGFHDFRECCIICDHRERIKDVEHAKHNTVIYGIDDGSACGIGDDKKEQVCYNHWDKANNQRWASSAPPCAKVVRK